MVKGLSSVRWGRILLASVATHVVNLVVTVLTVVVYAMVSTLPSGGEPDFVDQLAGGTATWGVPVLTFFAAAWVARKVEAETTVLHGLLVGLLVAVIFGLAFFWPFDLATLVLFALMVAAGPLGGLVGRRRANDSIEEVL